MIGDASQYDELQKLYGTFADEELQTLARDMNDLTEAAQQVLKVELGRRRLDVPAASAGEAGQQPDDLAESPLHAFAALAPEECVFEYAEIEDAHTARKVLAEQGIESIVADRQAGSMAVPRVVVAPRDSLTAELILSRPLAHGPDDLADEAADFVDSVCPHCGAADPMLESVDPTNHWHCEACDHLWSDAELPANG